jgi:hypothetical protein
VQVLEAREVAPGDDQVHAPLVLEVELAHGLAVLADDAERERRRHAAPQLRLLDDEPEPSVRHRQAANRLGGRRFAGVRGVLGVAARRSVAARLRADQLAGDPAAGEQHGQHGGERSELPCDHATTS